MPRHLFRSDFEGDWIDRGPVEELLTVIESFEGCKPKSEIEKIAIDLLARASDFGQGPTSSFEFRDV